MRIPNTIQSIQKSLNAVVGREVPITTCIHNNLFCIKINTKTNIDKNTAKSVIRTAFVNDVLSKVAEDNKTVTYAIADHDMATKDIESDPIARAICEYVDKNYVEEKQLL